MLLPLILSAWISGGSLFFFNYSMKITWSKKHWWHVRDWVWCDIFVGLLCGPLATIGLIIGLFVILLGKMKIPSMASIVDFVGKKCLFK